MSRGRPKGSYTYEEEELLEFIDEDTTKDDIKENAPWGYSVYHKRFGGLQAAKRKKGYTDVENRGRPPTLDWPSWLEGVDVDTSADGYVYVLDTVRKSDGERFYYVGMVTGGYKKLRARMSMHDSMDGSFSGPEIVDGFAVLASSTDTDYRIDDVMEVRSFHRGDESEDTFSRRLRWQEAKKVRQLILREGTFNVLGH